MSSHGGALARNFRAAFDRARLVERTHGGDVERWARHAGCESRQLVDFSASINPLGPPRVARRAFLQSYAELTRYPDPSGEQLRTTLAEQHGMDPRAVLLGNGSTQLIYLVCAALRPRAALIVTPAFSEYTNALHLAGATIRTFPLSAAEDFRFSLKAFLQAWKMGCDLVFLARPNSVTGQLIPENEIEIIADAALTRKSVVVVDEAFIDFTETESIKHLIGGNPYFFVLRSLTKFYGIPALRLGYLLGDPSSIERLAVFQEPWSVNGPAMNVARACLNDTGFASRTQRWLETEKQFLTARIQALEGLRPFASDANFLLVRIEQAGADARALRTFLLQRRMLIRVCDSFGLGVSYFRVAIRRRQENRRLVTALAEWLKS
jgi:threonine-phosphate decarboxylase